MNREITDQNYSQIIEEAGNKPVVIKFSAPWCGPCKRIEPFIEELAIEYNEQAIIGTCNSDENEELTTRYNIRNVPTVVFIQNGEVKDKQVGAGAKSVYEDKLKTLL